MVKVDGQKKKTPDVQCQEKTKKIHPNDQSNSRGGGHETKMGGAKPWGRGGKRRCVKSTRKLEVGKRKSTGTGGDLTHGGGGGRGRRS